jgi:hypothetical protein
LDCLSSSAMTSEIALSNDCGAFVLLF